MLFISISKRCVIRFGRCISGNLIGVEFFLISAVNNVVNIVLSWGLNVYPFTPSLIKHCEPANLEIKQRHPPCKASFLAKMLK